MRFGSPDHACTAANRGLPVTRFQLVLIAGVCGALLAHPRLARAQSALDGFNPGANNTVVALAVQPDGKVLVGGFFTALGGGTGTTARSRIGRLHADGSLDTSFDPGANGTVLTIVVQSDGRILVGGDFTTLGGGGTGTVARSRIARLNADGSVDAAFNPGASRTVAAMTVQADGKILVGGLFTTLGGGGTGTTARSRIGRLNADGSLDSSFDPGADSLVAALVTQADGRILVGGTFTMLGGGGSGTAARSGLGRLFTSGSVDTSFNPGATAAGLDGVAAMAVQPDGRILVGGTFTTLGGGGSGTTTRNRIGRLTVNGSLDDVFDPGADGGVLALTIQPDGKILVGGLFTTLGGGGTGTTPRAGIGRLHADGSVDTNFNPVANGGIASVTLQSDGGILLGGNFTTLGSGTPRNRIGRVHTHGSIDTDFVMGSDASIYGAAVQPDGKVVVVGTFTHLGGIARRRIGRFNADGSVDTTFDPGVNDTTWALALQPDGKILVGGSFTRLGGGGSGLTVRHNLGRLHQDGSIDTSFDPGADAGVHAIVVQPDGKLLIAGGFTKLGGGDRGATRRYSIGRLHEDGSVDTAFDPGANSLIASMALQPDGKIVVTGEFTRLGGGTGVTPRSRIGRVNADGTLDPGFNPGVDDTAYTTLIQPDGKILLGGTFSNLGGITRNRLGRLNADGSVDAAFDPGATLHVFTLMLQANGKILVGGAFNTLGGGGTGTVGRNRIGRLHADGSLDTSFNPGANGWVHTLLMQVDGKLVVAGDFTTVGDGGSGTPRDRIARVTNTDVAEQDLAVTGRGEAVVWQRSGGAPEIARATFEVSTDGIAFSPLGSATRVGGGWQLSGLSLPLDQNIYIRARGYYTTGFRTGSGSIVESIRNAFVSTAVTGFTDSPAIPRMTLVRAVHVTELRLRIDAQRQRRGLTAFSWTDSTQETGGAVKAVHIMELRAALRAAYVAAGLPTPSFTDDTLTPGETLIRAPHIEELRVAVAAIE